MSQWSHVLSPAELAKRYALTAELDARFARKQREFYERQTEAQLRALAHGAWNANDADGYQMARSHLEIQFPTL